jgi:hypothetical protein
LIFDAAQHGADGKLASLREGFMESKQAGPGCIMYAGSAGAPEPFELPGLKEKLSFRLFGVQRVNGTVRLTVNGETSEIPIPGYQILLGNLCVYLGGQVAPIAPPHNAPSPCRNPPFVGVRYVMRQLSTMC